MCWFCFYCNDDQPHIPVLSHSFPSRASSFLGFVLSHGSTKQFRLAAADCTEGNIQCPATQHALDRIIHSMPNQNNLHSRPPNSMVEAEPHATGRANLRFEFNISI